MAAVKRLAGNRAAILALVVLLAVIVVLSQTALGPQPAANSTAAAQAATAASAAASAGAKASPGTSQPGSSASASAPTAPVSSPGASAAAGSFLAQYHDPQADPAPNSLLTVLGLLLRLGIVLALIYVTVWILRFFNSRATRPMLPQRSITVLESTRLGPNRELYLVEVGEKVLLLGATTNTIGMLTEITDPDALDSLRYRPQPSLPSAEPFINYLRSFGEKFGQGTGLPGEAEQIEPAPLLTSEGQPADLMKRIEQSKQRIRERTQAMTHGD